MGMYTLLTQDIQLREDTPPDVLTILGFMTDTEQHWQVGQVLSHPPGVTLPGHPFFQCARWVHLFTMCSAYFDEPTGSRLEGLRLRTQANLKNYDSEITKYLDWISPYVDGRRLATHRGRPFVGRKRYEEDDQATLLFWDPQTGTIVAEEMMCDDYGTGISECTSHDGWQWPA